MITKELIKEIHRNAVAHGWWDKERQLPEIVALIHSELSEALEEYRRGQPLFWSHEKKVKTFRADKKEYATFVLCKPEGIAVELADAIIRILDYCGKEEFDITDLLNARSAANNTYDLPQLVAECHYTISQAFKSCKDRGFYLAECISIIAYWCRENGVDLDDVIRMKHEYNKHRPYRHGGKKC